MLNNFILKWTKIQNTINDDKYNCCGKDQLSDILPRIPIGQGNLEMKTFAVSLIRVSRTQAILAFGYKQIVINVFKVFPS